MHEIPIGRFSILVNAILVFGRCSAGFTFENLIKVIYIRKTANFGDLRNAEIICAYEIFCIVNLRLIRYLFGVSPKQRLKRSLKRLHVSALCFAASARQPFSAK